MCLAARSLAAGIAQLNCAYNALSAIAQLPYGRLVQGQGVEEVMRDVVQECLAASQDGHDHNRDQHETR